MKEMVEKIPGATTLREKVGDIKAHYDKVRHNWRRINTRQESVQYPVVEIAHELDDRFDLYYRMGVATAARKAGKPEINPEGIERSLYSRTQRALLLKDLNQGKISRVEAINEGHRLDEIDRQYAGNQREITIDMPGLGEQKAYAAEIDLAHSDAPPIFIIPALSGDLFGVEPLIKEAARRNRRVISVAYPESFKGQVSDGFADAVEKSGTYDQHTDYFKRAIEKLCSGTGDIEIWGYSTGAPIVAQILSDRKFQDRTTNAVLYAPASSIDQNIFSFAEGADHELGVVFNSIKKSADISFVTGSKEPVTKEHNKKRGRIFNSLLNRVRERSQYWPSMNVKNDGKIIVVTGGNDQITKSYRFSCPPNPQVIVAYDPAGSHLTPLTDAGYTVGQVTHLQQEPAPNRITTLIR